MIKGLVSIVLPIYNVEKYLERCITSVVSQTYQNLEIILVDDGSPDACPQICDEWAKKDSRIKVVHKKNAGLGMARNTGIENATGEYICFFDSDDYVVNDAIEKAYTLAKRKKNDIVTFGYSDIDRNGKCVKKHIPKTKKQTYIGQDVQDVFLPDMIAPNPTTGEETNLHMSAWASMYSMALIERSGWRFVSEREFIAEDVYSLLLLYKDVKTVSVLSEALYCYCENEASLTHTYRSDRYMKIVKFYHACQELHTKLGYCENVKDRLAWPYLAFTMAALKQIATADCDLKKRLAMQKEVIGDVTLQQTLHCIDKKRISSLKKILFFCIAHKMNFLCYVLLRAKG